MAVLVVGVVVGGVSAYVLAAGDDDTGGTATTGDADGGAPARAVRDFLTAEANLDCEAMAAVLSEQVVEESGGRREMIDDCEDSQEAEADEEDFSEEEVATILDSIETTSVRDGRATVTYTTPGEAIGELDPITMEVMLVEEGGAWKLLDHVPVAGDLPEGSPQAAARDHAQAVIDQDCEAFLAVLTERARAELAASPDERLAECEEYLGPRTPDAAARVGPVIRESQGDDRAVIAMTIFSDDYEAGNNIFYVTVVEEDGAWKVDQLAWSGDPDETD